jgi:hypothetical protein
LTAGFGAGFNGAGFALAAFTVAGFEDFTSRSCSEVTLL